MPRTTDDILAAVKDQQVEFISLQFTDIIGMVKNVTIPVAQLADCLDHGVWFDGSSIEGFARIAESDMFLVPDLETFAIVPWDQGAGFTTARVQPLAAIRARRSTVAPAFTISVGITGAPCARSSTR